MAPSPPRTRKTRLVLISDTHNQTPSLPQGDILIHAGDLTRQGSREELAKTAAWLERQKFEAVVVVAGNHDLTLDAASFPATSTTRKWASPQDCAANRRLFTQSARLTYLEHEAATIYLTDARGPRTALKVFGSPWTPNRRSWAWAYPPAAEASSTAAAGRTTQDGEGEDDGDEARKLWAAIPRDADVVVTHTPPRGHLDSAVGDVRTGCVELERALSMVRPMVSVFGHIHEGRGVEHVFWRDRDGTGSHGAGSHEVDEGGGHEGLVEKTEGWVDPGAGAGSKRQSLVVLCQKGRHPLQNCSKMEGARQKRRSELLGAGAVAVAGGADISHDVGISQDVSQEIGHQAHAQAQPYGGDGEGGAAADEISTSGDKIQAQAQAQAQAQTRASSSTATATSSTRTRVLLSGAIEVRHRPLASPSAGEDGDGDGDGDVDVAGLLLSQTQTDVEASVSVSAPGHHPTPRRETVMVNAAFMGPHHEKTTFFKPIVVDVDLPVWEEEEEDSEGEGAAR